MLSSFLTNATTVLNWVITTMTSIFAFISSNPITLAYIIMSLVSLSGAIVIGILNNITKGKE